MLKKRRWAFNGNLPQSWRKYFATLMEIFNNHDGNISQSFGNGRTRFRVWLSMFAVCSKRGSEHLVEIWRSLKGNILQLLWKYFTIMMEIFHFFLATAGLVSQSDFPCLQYAQKESLSILDMDFFSEYKWFLKTCFLYLLTSSSKISTFMSRNEIVRKLQTCWI